jgi:hypothetical protein
MLLHFIYLHNRLVHLETKKTPFEGYYGMKPDLAYLKLFGSRVCIKRTGDCRSKLDWHNFSGIFLGYASTDQNIIYLDINTGLVKQSHHAQFDEAWYLQPTRPPAAQLLYNLGLEADTDSHISTKPTFVAPMEENHIPLLPAPWPLLPSHKLDGSKWCVTDLCSTIPLPLCETEIPHPLMAAAARVWSPPDETPLTPSTIALE